MLKNIQLFTLLGLMLSGSTLHCAQTNDSMASAAEVETTTPTKKHKCTLCDKSFSSKDNLTDHKRLHTGEKPFQCNVCDKYFTQASNLKAHMRIHTGEKPFKCNQCNQSFAASNSLIFHKRTHTGEKPFQCGVCDKYFTQAPHLKAHMRIHTGEKPYQCNQCDQSFAASNSLIFHKRTHTGERPFKCNQCNLSFTQPSNLRRHNTTKKHKTNVLLEHAALASAKDFITSQSSLPNSLGDELINAHRDMIHSAQYMRAKDIFSAHFESPMQGTKKFDIMWPAQMNTSFMLPTSTNTDQFDAEQFLTPDATVFDQQFNREFPSFNAFSPNAFAAQYGLQSPQN